MSFLSRLSPLLLLAVLAAWPATAVADADDEVQAGATTVTNLTETGAKVSAYVHLGDDDDPEWWFEVDGVATPKTSTGVGFNATVSRTLAGLKPATTYRVRVVARNSDQSKNGSTATFRTATPIAAPAPAPAPAPKPAPAPPAGPGPAPEQGTGGAARPSVTAGAADAPVLGRTVVVGEVSGDILVRRPGAGAATPLSAADGVPVGSVVDARAGVVELRSAVGSGTQAGRFWGAVFQVRQSRAGKGMTDLVLRGGRPEGCGRRPATARAAAVSAKRKARKGLWGNDKGGRFRTHGRNSVATVRGTTWLVEETCAGTLTRVTEGAVVVRDVRRGRSVTVRAGGRYLARDGRGRRG